MSLQVSTIENVIIEISSVMREGNTPLVEVSIHGNGNPSIGFSMDESDIDALVVWAQWAKTQLPKKKNEL